MENALPNNLFRYLKEHIFNEQFPWYYIKTTGPADKGDDTYVYSFYHRFYEDSLGVLNPTLKPIMDSCIFSILDKANIEMRELYRSRTNLETIKPVYYEHTPHIDDERRHVAAVLYMNDSDGDTIFYKQQFDPCAGRGWMEDIDYINKNGGFEIERTITPQENKIVLFDGATYHSSFAPVKSHTRCVINFTFTTPDYY
jgi:hypothetical protein